MNCALCGQVVTTAITPKRTNKQIIESIKDIVCRENFITKTQLMSKKKTGEIVLARHLGMYLTYRHTPLTLHQVGKVYKRNHATVLYALRVIKDHIDVEPETKRCIDQILLELDL